MKLIYLNNTLKKLEKYPLMYLSIRDYNSLENFINGYLIALGDNDDIPYNRLFSEWLSLQNGYQTSLAWGAYIFNILAKKDKEKAYTLLLENLQKFLDGYTRSS